MVIESDSPLWGDYLIMNYRHNWQQEERVIVVQLELWLCSEDVL